MRAWYRIQTTDYFTETHTHTHTHVVLHLFRCLALSLCTSGASHQEEEYLLLGQAGSDVAGPQASGTESRSMVRRGVPCRLPAQPVRPPYQGIKPSNAVTSYIQNVPRRILTPASSRHRRTKTPSRARSPPPRPPWRRLPPAAPWLWRLPVQPPPAGCC